MLTEVCRPTSGRATPGHINDALSDAAADYYAEENDEVYWPPCKLGITSNGTDYDGVEIAIQKHVRHGTNPWSVTGSEGEDIHEALSWCHSCQIRNYCYGLMTASGSYTGIAGGTLVQGGEEIPINRKSRGQIRRENAARKAAETQPTLFDSERTEPKTLSTQGI